MRDLFSFLRAGLKEGCGHLTGENIRNEDFRPAAGKYGAKSAFTLRLKLDAFETAAHLHKRRAAFTLWGMPLVDAVHANGGHLLFTLTDCFYDAALNALINALPEAGALPLPQSAQDSLFYHKAPRQRLKHIHAINARICYVQRRMWMLSRRAQGRPYCAGHAEARHAFLLTAGLYDGMCKNRKKALLDCLDALLYMTRCVKPEKRRETLRGCAFIAKAAANTLYDLYDIHDQQKGRI